MYCILVTGIPAAGKSTMAEFLAERLELPVISKDSLKELLYDMIGFCSREEKVKLGIAAPREVPVYRKEVYIQIQEANKEAMNTDTLENLKNLLG